MIGSITGTSREVRAARPGSAADPGRWSGLAPEQRDRLQHLLVDALGLAAAGAANDDARSVLAGLAAVSPGESRVPWTRLRLAAPQAATALSTLIHAWDFDDTHDEAVVHTAAVVVPAAVAAMATSPAPGERFLDGLATGVQLFSRLARLVGPRPGVIRTAGLGALAAAATAATVWGLDEADTENAVALCLGAALAPATRQAVVDGSVAKRLQPGLATAHGVTAASLARSGVIGPAGWLGGTYGVLPGSELRLADLLTGPAELDAVALKPYPACRYTHAALAAGEQLYARHPGPEALHRMVAHLPAGAAYELVARPWRDRGSPLVDAQFSLPWQLAALWVTGRYDLTTLRGDLGRADIAAAAARIEVRQDLPESTVMAGARLELETPDGRHDTAEARMPGTGDARPGRDAVDRKLLGCLDVAGAADPRAVADGLWQLAAELPSLDASGVGAALRRRTAVP
ncbi:2-methylcitrate dehydratase PrpD [Pseudonocardia ammonioxydans]|uniref:2-methylcitrate dehydratase PrpD n=1 Tax=Pseudonocardia ammonioxydans TaxID=260086 RepID=A0A1I5AQD9_PSUAM|nr:MmgE/PrpD family protein [Pseudonocardia ammonioxydans]SFN64756.1 2-methylcitrate dehydratase PrpD [Pseudonocardia ammonioxydans]